MREWQDLCVCDRKEDKGKLCRRERKKRRIYITRKEENNQDQPMCCGGVRHRIWARHISAQIAIT
jgi:hypothetical protein